MKTFTKRTLAHAEWMKEAVSRFGKDPMKWAFECPACGHVATVQDYKDARAPEGAVAFSCIGVYAGAKRDAFGLADNYKGLKAEGPGPCNYAGGGLFAINPVTVIFEGHERRTFEFADATVQAEGGAI